MALKEQLYKSEEIYLEERGWEKGYQESPDGAWMYKKEYEGKVLMVKRDTALEFEYYHFKK